MPLEIAKQLLTLKTKICEVALTLNPKMELITKKSVSRSTRRRKRKININKKLDTYTYYELFQSMKGSWDEQDGLLHKRSSKNVTS